MKGETIRYLPIYTNFSINYNYQSPCKITELHYHNSYEFLVPFYDGMKCVSNNQIYEVKKGDIFIIPPGVAHKVVIPCHTIYERYVIYFRIEYMYNFSPLTEKLLCGFFIHPVYDVLHIHLDQNQTSHLLTLLKKNTYYLNTSGFGQEIYIQHAFFEILLLLSKEVYLQNSKYSRNRNVHYIKVKEILDYVNYNLTQDLSLDHLTEKFYMSKTYLNNLFKLHTGSTVNQYIISSRIASAKKLLQEGVPVSLIYDRVGFNNYSHFIRTFTKIVGISPKQYAFQCEKL